jgi:hypothetical protein
VKNERPAHTREHASPFGGGSLVYKTRLIASNLLARGNTPPPKGEQLLAYFINSILLNKILLNTPLPLGEAISYVRRDLP